MRSYELGNFLKLCVEKKVSALRVVPSVARQMVKEGCLDGYELGSVQAVLSEGGRLEDEVVKRLQERLRRAPIIQGYG